MAERTRKPDEPDLTTLIREIAQGSEKLIGQQFSLFRIELEHELYQARDAVSTLGAGAALVATGGVLASLMVVHALHRSTRLPLWGCYGLVGGLMGAVGTGLLASGLREAAAIRRAPLPQTVEALKENLGWLQDQATAPPAT
jgi:uncharacterized membrane protein YedE/YeeE